MRQENESMPLVKSTCEALEKQLQQLQTRAQPLLDRAMPIIDSNADTGMLVTSNDLPPPSPPVTLPSNAHGTL